MKKIILLIWAWLISSTLTEGVIALICHCELMEALAVMGMTTCIAVALTAIVAIIYGVVKLFGRGGGCYENL